MSFTKLRYIPSCRGREGRAFGNDRLESVSPAALAAALLLCLSQIPSTDEIGRRRRVRIVCSGYASPGAIEKHEELRARFSGKTGALGRRVSKIGTLVLGVPCVEVALRTAAVKLGATHSDGEGRQLAEWQRPLPTPEVARVALPAHPLPPEEQVLRSQGSAGMRREQSQSDQVEHNQRQCSEAVCHGAEKR